MNRWSEFFVLLAIGIFLLIGASKLRIEEGELPERIVESDPYENLEDKQTYEEEVLREYHVVVGSFTDELNAQNYIKELELMGYEGKILVSDDFLYRVSIFSSDVREDCSQFKEDGPIELRMWILYEPLGID
jgi:hypothetical protein